MSTDRRPLPTAVFWSLKNRVRYHREFPHVVASLPGLYGDPCKGGGVGDCNDFAVSTAALGKIGRYDVRWAYGFDADGDIVHVWTQMRPQVTAGLPILEWVDVDPTPGAPPPGMGSPVDVPGARVVGYWTQPV